MFKIGDKVAAIQDLPGIVRGIYYAEDIKKNEVVTIVFINPVGSLQFKEKNHNTLICNGWWSKFFRKIQNSPKSAIKELIESFKEVEEKVDVELPVEI